MQALAETRRRVVPLKNEPPPDAELVERARTGDRWAQEILFKRHFPAVASTVARLLGDRHEAEDVVQDTFTAALAELGALREPAAFRGWLVQIAVRKVHRRFRRRRLLRALGLDHGEPEGGLAGLAGHETSPEDRAELALLDRALGRLGPADRVAWSLRHVEGMQLEDVAVAAGCSLATAKRRIAAADRFLRAHVDLGGSSEEGDAA